MRKYLGVTIGMAINNAALSIQHEDYREQEEEWAATIVKRAKLLLKEMDENNMIEEIK